MMRAHAVIHSEQPTRLMNRLSKHWAHKFPVENDGQECTITLPLGICRMLCTDILRVVLDCDEQQMLKLQQVVADHLQRMAGSEELSIEWQQPD